MSNRNSCGYQKVKAHAGSCKRTRGGTPTVKGPLYKLKVLFPEGNTTADKPVDVAAK
jgi:hypothetical protein